MTDQEKREAARQFINRWIGKGDEKQDSQLFWIGFLQVLGIENITDYIQFERPVMVDGAQKYIDAYLPQTRVMIEQKSLRKDLSKPEIQSGGAALTPYQQAKRYANSMPLDEMPRFIVTCNFKEFWIYDQNKPGQEPEKVRLDSLQDSLHRFDFMVTKTRATITEEMELSIKAGELVGKLHDRFLQQYNDPLAKRTQRSLNILCVRLVFCLYAEDAGLFGSHDAFQRYIQQYEPKDIRQALLSLFKVLDTPLDERPDLYLPEDLESFPYVNGGLFKDENIIIPKITKELKDTIMESARFDWSHISPTIFGAVFESTLNPQTRREGGMHYTSIENIHKIIDPLFLNDLRSELQEIEEIQVARTQKVRLKAFHNKLASLSFFDPACGSGNFLTETFLSLRRIENEVLKLRIAADSRSIAGQMVMDFDQDLSIKVSIKQLYGIEINDFAVTVARTALWIAESQMIKETEDIVQNTIEFFPLKLYPNIIEGNSLRIDWDKVISKNDVSYILGNPPFVGTNWLSDSQRVDMDNIWKSTKRGKLDYVTCWYVKAAEYLLDTDIKKCAFVSTNSICQGEQAVTLWKKILIEYGFEIQFAYSSFVWESESNSSANVHVVIVCISKKSPEKKTIYDSNGTPKSVNNINQYLLDAPTAIIEEHSSPICSVPAIMRGSQATDNGYYLFTPEEKEAFLKKEPQASGFFRRFMMGREFINNIERWCLWMPYATPSEIKKCPLVMERIQLVKEFRESSRNSQTKKAAEFPQRFGQFRPPTSHYIAFAKVSSERRRYIPMGFLTDEIIPGDKLFTIPNADIYMFGILMSNVHNAWMRMLCGRMKSDYSYSTQIVYNTFPWPSPSDAQREKIKRTAQGILDARDLYPESTLADLYDPLTMPPELRKAHDANNRAVMQAYEFDFKTMSESDCVAALMKMYQEMA